MAERGSELEQAARSVPKVEVRLNKPQSLAYRAMGDDHTVVTPWGRGVGKSKFQRLCWYLAIAELDGKARPGASWLHGIRILLLAPTFKQAIDVHAAALELELGGQWKFLRGKLRKDKYRVDFPGGSSIQFFGAENADAVRGLRCDMITVDECDDVDPDIFDAICQPWLSEPWSKKRILAGGTPRRGRHGLLWKLDEFAREKRPGFASIRATYKDAPENVSQEFVERVRAITPPEIFAREWECDFDSAEGLVYSTFLEKFHVRPADPRAKYSEILVGVDHGFEDPGVFLVVGVQGSGHDAACHVLYEVVEKGRDTSWWQQKAREVLKAFPKSFWFIDPSRPDRIEDLRKVGVRAMETDNAIDAGVSAIQDRLTVRRAGNDSYARLYVDPTCKNLIREFGLYRRKRNPRNKAEVLEAIEDKHNHTMDALRYAIYSRFGGPQAVRNLHNLPAY